MVLNSGELTTLKLRRSGLKEWDCLQNKKPLHLNCSGLNKKMSSKLRDCFG